MKHNLTKFSFILILLILISGCAPTIQKKSSTFSWHTETVQLLNKSEDNDGGFAELLSEREPSLYDTYYDSILYRQLNEKIPHIKELESSIQQIKIPAKISSFADLNNVYYLTSGYKEFGLKFTVQNRNRLKEEVLKLQQPNGLFKLSNSKDGIADSLNATQESLVILNNLGVSIDKKNLTNTIKNIARNLKSLSGEEYGWTYINSIQKIELSLHEKCSLSNPSIESFLQQKGSEVFSKAPNQVGNVVNDIMLLDTLKSLGKAPLISTNYKTGLEKFKSLDGGYSILGNNTPSDPQFTIQIINMIGSENGINHYIQHIDNLQLPSGMFTDNGNINSILAYSYMCEIVFNDLQEKLPNKLVSFVSGYPLSSKSSIYDIYYRHMGVRLASGQSFNNLQNVVLPKGFEVNSPNSAEILVAILKIATISKTSIGKMAKQILVEQKSSGGFGLGRDANLKDTRICVEALDDMGVNYNKAKVQNFILEHQNSDGGFSSEGTSTIDQTYDALSALSQLNKGSIPSLKYDVNNFITICESPYGGYFEAPSVKNVSLLSTYYGCESSRLINF